ncbi:hypothetical protein EJ06DRAFT_561200, partial [Trichodelitschia bisporula]
RPLHHLTHTSSLPQLRNATSLFCQKFLHCPHCLHSHRDKLEQNTASTKHLSTAMQSPEKRSRWASIFEAQEAAALKGRLVMQEENTERENQGASSRLTNLKTTAAPPNQTYSMSDLRADLEKWGRFCASEVSASHFVPMSFQEFCQHHHKLAAQHSFHLRHQASAQPPTFQYTPLTNEPMRSAVLSQTTIWTPAAGEGGDRQLAYRPSTQELAWEGQNRIRNNPNFRHVLPLSRVPRGNTVWYERPLTEVLPLDQVGMVSFRETDNTFYPAADEHELVEPNLGQGLMDALNCKDDGCSRTLRSKHANAAGCKQANGINPESPEEGRAEAEKKKKKGRGKRGTWRRAEEERKRQAEAENSNEHELVEPSLRGELNATLDGKNDVRSGVPEDEQLNAGVYEEDSGVNAKEPGGQACGEK